MVGTVIADKYRVVRAVGAGAMGKVYEAEQVALSRRVAIKVLRGEMAGDSAFARRFQREARAASAIDHTNCVRVIDFGQTPDGDLYLVMEFIQGRDLAEVLEKEGPLPLGRVVRIASQVCSALDEAHAHGIVHRDLKPANIMLVDRRGEKDHVKVCDFGIAKLDDANQQEQDGTLTMAGMVCGTPDYMAPEQARGESLDGRSDLYALGVVLYEAVTGKRPFRASSPVAVMSRHLTEKPLAPSKIEPRVDARLEKLILKALAKNRDKRPSTAIAFREALDGLITTAFDSGAPAAQTALATEAVSKAQPKTRRLAATLGIAGVGALALWWLAGGTAEPPSSAPSGPHPEETTSADPNARVKVEAIAQAPAARDSGVAAQDESAPEPRQTAKHESRRRKRDRSDRKSSPRGPKEPLAAPGASATEGRMEFADHLFNRSRYKEAIPIYQKISQQQPRLAAVHKRLGMAYSRIGQITLAKTSYQRYLQLAPNASDRVIIENILSEWE